MNKPARSQKLPHWAYGYPLLINRRAVTGECPLLNRTQATMDGHMVFDALSKFARRYCVGNIHFSLQVCVQRQNGGAGMLAFQRIHGGRLDRRELGRKHWYSILSKNVCRNQLAKQTINFHNDLPRSVLKTVKARIIYTRAWPETNLIMKLVLF